MDRLMLVEVQPTKLKAAVLRPERTDHLGGRDPRLLLQLSKARICGGFAGVDSTTGKFPPMAAVRMRRVVRPDQQHVAVVVDQYRSGSDAPQHKHRATVVPGANG